MTPSEGREGFIPGGVLAPPPLRVVAAHLAEGLAEYRSLHDPERVHYEDGGEVTVADRDGLVALGVARDVEAFAFLDETQTAELASDLLWRAIKVCGDVDWRLRAAHHLLRDIHDREAW